MNETNFYSLDRLVEFGLSMAFATQMIEVMNQSLMTMQTPRANILWPGGLPHLDTPHTDNIYVILNSEKLGPLSGREFASLVTRNEVTKNTKAWIPGLLAWKEVQEIPSLLKIIALTPPPLSENI